MKKISSLAFFVLLSCAQQKPSEPVATSTMEEDTLATTVSEPVPAELPAASEPELSYKTIPVENNGVLEALVNNPFPKDLEAMKAMLDSMGVTSEWENGGGLSYDSAAISYNRSYGESICEADIQSAKLALNKGITIGMALTDFLTLTGIKSWSQGTLRYEYTYSAQEHTYTIRFDFANNVLIRFFYQKDPCVIYD